jgi:hypothetical protein
MHKPRDGGGGYTRGKGRGGEVIAEFEYKDKNNNPYLLVKKTKHHDFSQWHWVEKGVTGKSHWASGAPKGPKIPYMLPQLIKHPLDQPLFIAEGEKDT